jgi:hypothetical protein
VPTTAPTSIPAPSQEATSTSATSATVNQVADQSSVDVTQAADPVSEGSTDDAEGPFRVLFRVLLNQESFSALNDEAKTELGTRVAMAINGATFIEWQNFSGRRLLDWLTQMAVLEFDDLALANAFRASVSTIDGANQIQQDVKTSIATSNNADISAIDVSATRQDVTVQDTTPTNNDPTDEPRDDEANPTAEEDEEGSKAWIAGVAVGVLVVVAIVAFLVRRSRKSSDAELNKRAQQLAQEEWSDEDMEFGNVHPSRKSSPRF